MLSFDEILSYFPQRLKAVFSLFGGEIIDRVTEIRVRRGNYLSVVIRNTSYFVDCNADLYDVPSHHCITVGQDEFDELFMGMCSYSLYSVQESLKRGYITLEGGARVGVAGCAVYDAGDIVTVKNVTSLNIRLPKEIKGCAESVVNFLYVNRFPSVIVAGRPNSGKTTLLRDIARLLSDGSVSHCRKITVVDERAEICAAAEGTVNADVGACTDVLSCFSKAQGIETASRTLSPDMIICDEISTEAEVKAVSQAFSSGIAFALSVHIADREDLLRRSVVRMLLSTGEFSYIVLLDGCTYRAEIIDTAEVINEIIRRDGASALNLGSGNLSFSDC